MQTYIGFPDQASGEASEPSATSVAEAVELEPASPDLEGEELEEEDWDEGDEALLDGTDVPASLPPHEATVGDTQVVVSDSEDEKPAVGEDGTPGAPCMDLRLVATPQNKPHEIPKPPAPPVHMESYESNMASRSLESLCDRTQALHISRDAEREDLLAKLVARRC